MHPRICRFRALTQAPFNFLILEHIFDEPLVLLKIIVGAPRQWSCRITKSSWKPYTTKGTSSAKQQAYSSSSWTRWVYDLTYKLFFLFILVKWEQDRIAHYIPHTCKSQWSQACTHKTFFIDISKLNSMKPPLYKWHLQGDGKWLLTGGWPLDRGSLFPTQGHLGVWCTPSCIFIDVNFETSIPLILGYLYLKQHPQQWFCYLIPASLTHKNPQ